MSQCCVCTISFSAANERCKVIHPYAITSTYCFQRSTMNNGVPYYNSCTRTRSIRCTFTDTSIHIYILTNPGIYHLFFLLLASNYFSMSSTLLFLFDSALFTVGWFSKQLRLHFDFVLTSNNARVLDHR